ncbi:MAG: lipopolysaccharide biosynthesis protein [Bacillota bacterium]
MPINSPEKGQTEKHTFIETVKRQLSAGSFAGNVLTLMTGTAFAQALLILVSPILTRLYSPDDFGVFALYLSILGIISVVACWRYQLAIVLPEKEAEAANLLAISILIAFLTAFLSFLAAAFFRHPAARLLGAPHLAPWLWFLPFSLLAGGLFQAFNYWSTRRKQFKRLAARQMTQGAVTAAAQLGLGGFSNLASGGLIGGHLLGQLTATLRLSLQIWRDEGKQILSHIKLPEIKRLLFRYKDFPLYDSWSSLLNTGSTMLPALLLGYYFNPAVVGFYALGHRVLALPMSILGGAAAQAFFPRAAEAKRAGELDEVTLAMFRQLLQMGSVPILLAAMLAPELFALIFGPRWLEAGVYAQWMCLWLVFQFASSPISSVINVLERQRLSLLFNLIMFGGRVLALVMGGLRQNPLLAVQLLGLVGAFMYLGYSVLILHLAKVKAAKIAATLMRVALRSMPFLAVPLLAVYLALPAVFCVSLGIISGIFFVVYSLRITSAGG